MFGNDQQEKKAWDYIKRQGLLGLAEDFGDAMNGN